MKFEAIAKKTAKKTQWHTFCCTLYTDIYRVPKNKPISKYKKIVLNPTNKIRFLCQIKVLFKYNNNVPLVINIR